MNKTILLNIGNSNTEIALWNGESMLSTKRLQTESLINRIGSLDLFHRNKFCPILAACVVPSVKRRLQRALPEWTINWLSADSPLGLDLTMIEKATIGADRLANAVAAVNELDLPAIVLDCGTAITSESIDRNKRLLGGMIMPGRKLARWALKTGTGQLPNVEMSNELPSALGKNTLEAIRAGIDLGHLGSVERVLLETRAQIGEPGITVIAIGGDRHFFAENLPNISLGPEFFTLKGLSLVAKKL